MIEWISWLLFQYPFVLIVMLVVAACQMGLGSSRKLLWVSGAWAVWTLAITINFVNAHGSYSQAARYWDPMWGVIDSLALFVACGLGRLGHWITHADLPGLTRMVIESGKK